MARTAITIHDRHKVAVPPQVNQHLPHLRAQAEADAALAANPLPAPPVTAPELPAAKTSAHDDVPLGVLVDSHKATA